MVRLTLLQRGVLERMRRAGHEHLADLAFEEWRRGSPTGWRFDDGESLDLIEDYRRANEQAAPED